MKGKRATLLFDRYRNGKANPHEKAIVESWYLNEISKSSSVNEDVDYLITQDKIWNKIIANRPYQKQFTLKWMPIAAAVLVVFCVGMLYYLITKPNDKVYNSKIIPGKVGATLTLANGKSIKLTDAAPGQVANEAGINIVKTADGEIVYQVTDAKNDVDHINTLTTSRGETYLVVLPDQSKVWMNAASSLTYTTNLEKDGLRMVSLSGEAYFEITKDKRHPFVVTTKNQQVKVLGTHFNINAYDDEQAIKTTLLEGSVEINNDIILKPNQQAVLTNKSIKVIPVIADSFIDWQQGAFNFEDENLYAIMRKIARWYDVDVVYSGTETDPQTFSGFMARSADIQKVLQNLAEISNVKFKVKNRVITVSR